MTPPTPSTSSVAPIRAWATTWESPAKSAATSALGIDGLAVDGLAQEAAALVRPQLGVEPALREQAAVRPFLDDAALVHHHQPVHRGDGGEAVRDGDDRLALHQLVEAGLDGGFDFRVQRAGGLVEQQDRRVLEHHASDGNALPLAAREFHAAFAD